MKKKSYLLENRRLLKYPPSLPFSLSFSLLGHARFRGRAESRATRVAGKEY